jgi:hypothetical protein
MANKAIPDLTAASSVSSADLVHVVQGGNSRQATVGKVIAAGTASSRTALAAITGQASGDARYLTESGREGTFVWSTTNLSSAVAADTQQGVYVAPSSDTTGASGAWVRKPTAPLHPKHFGAAYDGTTDDATAFAAFAAFWASNSWPSGYSMAGSIATNSALTLDGGTFGNNVKAALAFGECHITALSALDKILTIQDCYGGSFSGFLHIMGTGYTSDNISGWTCNVGLYLDNCAQSSFGSIYGEGLNYAVVEVESNPGNNDSLHIGNVVGKRVSSGDSSPAGRSLTANWSSPVQSGSYGSVSATETLTVDAFPSAYVTGADGTPVHPIYVEISGILHHVTNVNRVAGTITLGRWIQSALGSSGTLRYHYGASLVYNGSDSNICNVGHVSQVGGGCAVDFACPYGGHIAQIHLNSGGGAVRIGGLLGAESGQMIGLTIGNLYVEAGHQIYDICSTGRSSNHVKILSRSASTDTAKVINTHTPLQSDETYNSETYMIGFTNSAIEGFHFPRKRFVGTASEAIDFGKPRTFPGQVFYSKPTTDTAAFTLTAPGTNQQRAYGYDCSMQAVIGRTSHGGPAGNIVYTPTTGTHTINGGAAGAAATFTGFDCPPIFVGYYDDNGAWTYKQANPRQSASPTLGIGYSTGAGGTVTQATSRTTGVTLNKVTGAITLVSAAGSAAWQSFTITNSTVAATDTIRVVQKSGTDKYMIHVTAVAAGSFEITYATTGGTTTEQPVFNFTVVRGVTA